MRKHNKRRICRLIPHNHELGRHEAPSAAVDSVRFQETDEAEAFADNGERPLSLPEQETGRDCHLCLKFNPKSKAKTNASQYTTSSFPISNLIFSFIP